MDQKRELPRFTGNRDWLFGLLLVLATLLAYGPALNGQFVWDDDSWTSNIAGLLRDLSGLRSIWCHPTALQQYYPLAGTSFWLDYHLWGFWTLPYHFENVLLHATAALLFWRLLLRLKVPGAWLAGAIFALHPVMVESAGWITERKNVLSLVFYLGALQAYGWFNRFWQGDNAPGGGAFWWGEATDEPGSRGRSPHRDAKTYHRHAPGDSAQHRRRAYALALLLFAAALLAKATAFSLPAVLLLLCWWKRGRIRWRADALPALPFFALTLGLGLLTAWLEKHHVGAEGSEWAMPFPERCLIAGRALWFYAAKLLWPVNLCFVYPRWQLDARSFGQWLYPVTAAGTLLSLWLARGRIGRGPATAAFFFAGTLFPVLGFMNAYGARYSFVWDHWVYLSSLGLIALGAGGMARAVERRRAPAMLYGFAGVMLPVLAVLTWRQSRMFTNMETLWNTTLTRNPDAAMAYVNLGGLLLEADQVDEAMAQFQKAREIDPHDEDACYNLGLALLRKGQVDAAMVQFRKAIEIQPGYARAHYNLGTVLYQKGQVNQAIAQLRTALETRPDYAEAHNNLGAILLEKGQVDEAIFHFQKALEAQPANAQAQCNLGNLLLQQGRVDEAIAHLQKALEIQPDLPEVRQTLAELLSRQQGQPAQTNAPDTGR